MNKGFHDHATEANHSLIAQVATYYNSTKESIDFYKELNSSVLQEMSEEHLQHWKRELRSLIFYGMNCSDERSA
jgi:hypothetical protein